MKEREPNLYVRDYALNRISKRRATSPDGTPAHNLGAGKPNVVIDSQSD